MSPSPAVGDIIRDLIPKRTKKYTTIYFSTVVPITDYEAGVYGFKAYYEHDKLQNKTIRTFLRIGKSTCLFAVEAETGWFLPRYRIYREIIRLWHRLANMDINLRIQIRNAHKVFLWDLPLIELYRNTWCGDVKTYFKNVTCSASSIQT